MLISIEFSAKKMELEKGKTDEKDKIRKEREEKT